MLFGKNLLAFVPLLAGFAAASSALEERDVCISINGPVIQVYITTQVVNVPVLVNTYVPTNGVITVAGGTTINIYNAPTQVVTVVNSVATQTNSQTATVTVGPNGISTQVGPTYNIINFPVYISTFIQQNTIINNQGATITINNAPTTVITTATGTITSTVTTTSVITSNVPQQTIILQVVGQSAPVRKARRQALAGGFLAADGSLSGSCSSAVPLLVQNQQLVVANTANYYSANVNDTVVTFAASSVVKAISTVFAAGSDTTLGLSWTNPAFANNGSAVFFVQNNFLKAQLQGTAPVAMASIATIAASNCVNGQIVTATSTSTSTAATSTSSGSSTTSGSSALTTTTGASTGVTTTVGQTTTVTTTVVNTVITTTSASTIITTTVPTTVTTAVVVTTTSAVTTTASPPPTTF